MNSPKYVGLIDYHTSAMPFGLDTTSRKNGFQLKKVLVEKNISDDIAKTFYPRAELVRYKNAILDDKTIELVIVSGKVNGYLNLVGEALKAGKKVRII